MDLRTATVGTIIADCQCSRLESPREIPVSQSAVATSGVGLQRRYRQASVCLHRPSRPRTNRTVTSGANHWQLRSDDIKWAILRAQHSAAWTTGGGRSQSPLSHERYGSRGRRERLTTSINSTRRLTCIRWFAGMFRFWQHSKIVVHHTIRAAPASVRESRCDRSCDSPADWPRISACFQRGTV